MLIFFVFLPSEWASARGIDENIGGKTKEELNKDPRLFYAEAKNKDGGNYSRSTLLGFRNGIERFLNNPPFKKGIHIATSSMGRTTVSFFFAVVSLWNKLT